MTLSKLTKYCACHAKWLSRSIRDTPETLFTMRGTTGGILQHHQILRLPRKMTVMTDPRHIWNAIYNARNNQCHPPTSPNTAPATQNDCHNWSSSHVKRYFQCAEQPVSSWNISEYCACHAKWLSNISKKFLENSWNVISNAGPIRPWSENDPRMIREWNRQSATRLATEVTFHAHHEHFVLKITTFRAPAIIPNFTEYCACHEKWHSNFTKYCACHEKWHSSLIQTHQILRLPRKVTLQLHQILRLPLSYDLTTPITWRHLLLDDTYYWTTPITGRHYLTTPTTWRHLLLDDTYYWTTLLDDTYYLTTLLDDTYYLTTPNTSRHYLTTLLDDTYYLTTPITGRHYLTTPITWRHLLLDDT